MDAVVVSYNNERDLRQLLACRPVGEAFDRIIVVDNASTDGSRECARASNVELVARETNDGFGAAANAGAARTRGASFALLNPDIRFIDSESAERLAGSLDDPDVAVVGPALVLPDGSLQDSARRVPTPVQLLRRRLSEDPHGSVSCHTPCDVPWLVAACLVVRRSAFDQLGGFDEKYFLYFEDVDLCVRMRAAGWKVRYDPTVRVRHDHAAASRAGFSKKATRLHLRSAARFFASNPRAIIGSPPPEPR